MFFIFFNCLYEKYHVVDLLAPEQKKKSIYALIFYDYAYEKICEAKLLISSYKKEALNLFFFIGRRQNRR